MKNKILKNMAANTVVYKSVLGICGTLCKISSATGITDIYDIRTYIESLSPADFCSFDLSASVSSPELEAEFVEEDSQ